MIIPTNSLPEPVKFSPSFRQLIESRRFVTLKIKVMKKILLILSFLAASAFLQKGNTQCTLANPGIKWNYSQVDGANCKIGIDLYFDIIHNSGGKWVWVHIFPAGDYSNFDYSEGKPPTLANGGLVGSIATFGFFHHGTDLYVATSYSPDGGAPGFQYQYLTLAEGTGQLAGSTRYTIQNIVLTIPGGCNTAQSFKADVWESQAADAQKVHCYITEMDFVANDPTITGLLLCQNPRRYTFTVSSLMTTGSMDISYKVYIDDGDGIFNLATDNIMVFSGTTTLNAANQFKYNSGIQDYLPYSNTKPYSDRDLWVEVTSPAVPNAVYGHIINTCIPLPVKLSSFTALRTSDRVKLNWTTASEINNRGFYILRQNGNNGWQVMGYVPSAALNGNSDAPIQYSFTDMNNLGGVTQYRLQQVDMDNSITYSDIRMVKGMDQSGRLLVFPNPSPDGNLNIVLDNMGTDLNVRLIDMNGRLVKEWDRVTNGKIFVSQVASGMYTLRVYEKNTGQVHQMKVIVSK